MPIDTLYGFEDDDLERIRKVVEQALGATLEHHTNAYRGEHYVGSTPSDASLILQRNWDPFDGELMEEHFPNMRVLLYITSSGDADELDRQLTIQTAAQMLLRPEP